MRGLYLLCPWAMGMGLSLTYKYMRRYFDSKTDRILLTSPSKSQEPVGNIHNAYLLKSNRTILSLEAGLCECYLLPTCSSDFDGHAKKIR